MEKAVINEFINILKEELVPAMGCTEPIALAFASAKAAELLGSVPEKITARCSGNIIKNVRCVTIPNSGGMTGIETACVLGAFGGDSSRHMEVLESVSDEARALSRDFISKGLCEVLYLDSDIPLHFSVEIQGGGNRCRVEIQHSHTNIVKIERNGEILLDSASAENEAASERTNLSVENIREFADSIDLSEVLPLIERQISCNMAIAEEGMSGKYGLGIGKTVLDFDGNSLYAKMRAFAAAGSEARMAGCDMPVVINSGSGNQGIASSVPVIVYAREKNIPEEKLFRALVFSSLLTVYQKEYIGKLSAFCGAVSASCAAGAAITYICGGTVRQIKDTIANTLANIPGILCDGAKISCAAKIASSLDSALLAHTLAMKGKAYEAFTGLLKEDAGETISCVGYIGKVGMRQTDKEIIKVMLN